MHCVPRNEEQRLIWRRMLNRKDFIPKEKDQVCSKHFVNGKPTKENPAPKLHMSYSVKNVTTPRRPLVRKCVEINTPSKEAINTHKQDLQVDINGNVCSDETAKIYTATPCSPVKLDISNCSSGHCESGCCYSLPDICKNKPKLVDTSTQTIDIVASDHAYGYSKKTRSVSCQQSVPKFSMNDITTDSEAKFYTGLSLTVLLTLIRTLSGYGNKLPYKLSVGDQILAVLVRLRLGLTFQDLARRINVSLQLMTNIFHSWIDIMAKHLTDCVVWLPRETIRRTLPTSFRNSYPHTTCFIDCSEIFIQRPFALKAPAQT